MINSEFLTANAAHFAKLIQTEAGPQADLPQKIEIAYWTALSRAPSAAESKLAQNHIHYLSTLYEQSGTKADEAHQRSFENFAHMLLCSNEFLYID